ncbi:MAG TPA: hypothetical protein VK781_06375 [Solirubrobacteraceae bacterium]|nr:hypothetical protein [Solirubrobacteraceae bacterium]
MTLPQGLVINPGVANGLQGCDATGPAGINIPTGLNSSGEPLKPGEVGPGEEVPPQGLGPEEPLLAPGHCPSESVVGSAEATTPLLDSPIEGRVYIAAPGCGGPGQGACTEQDAIDGNLYRLYVELGAGPNANGGVLLKLAATIQANPATGQLTVRLLESPQLPLSELSLHLLGGDHGLLTNPTTCGPATTTSDLKPWSAPYTLDASPSSYFNVEGCANQRPFDPGFLAGSISATAGAFSPFAFTVTRKDGEQNLVGIQVHAPLGLSAMLSSVPLCPESLASIGDCPEASRVGGSQVSVGAGSQPLRMQGNVYLTGPYEGAPFGLAIITDAVAGPLDLGRLVMRARINIDPRTAALTITSDQLPQIVLGIPLYVRGLSVTLDRPHFVFNPTSCDGKQITATIAGAQAVSVGASSQFALRGCKGLVFKPKIAASTTARTSLSIGASLDVRIAFPKAEQGTYANLARIKVDLPTHLPSRLTTLQSACAETTFNLDAAQCPSASIVGIVVAQTPLLSTGLIGPVYFVAHGRNAFPSPALVLQGDGLRLDLVGSTNINKAGVASVAFNAIPDIPLNSLELYLPRGPHSLLDADTSLCNLRRVITVKRKIAERVHGRTTSRTVQARQRAPASLPMPTELAAHNGAIVRQTAKVEVTGCITRKVKSAHRPQAR